jgi:uncharacterized membrane protein YeaQ/YmgE (transglycosylase-associated protein family)
MFALAWFISNERTNPTIAIYILFIGGMVALVLLWRRVLTGEAVWLELACAAVATVILGVVGSMIASMKIKKNPLFSPDSILESATCIAFILGLIGLTILICGCIPDATSEGPDSPIDRKYSVLFFALMAYAFLFSFFTSEKTKGQ